eukprot:TRINITY_DN3803_c0_g1_i3.p1 TRINITY_DN3803_c0_g1~~TRINITY_DN3803_c0_g1_i3.p1  ORF type:complete len:767 (-),score=218.53 TRINITY_DN3803_c0_g1_i3:632-2932(-)
MELQDHYETNHGLGYLNNVKEEMNAINFSKDLCLPPFINNIPLGYESSSESSHVNEQYPRQQPLQPLQPRKLPQQQSQPQQPQKKQHVPTCNDTREEGDETREEGDETREEGEKRVVKNDQYRTNQKENLMATSREESDDHLIATTFPNLFLASSSESDQNFTHRFDADSRLASSCESDLTSSLDYALPPPYPPPPLPIHDNSMPTTTNTSKTSASMMTNTTAATTAATATAATTSTITNATTTATTITTTTTTTTIPFSLIFPNVTLVRARTHSSPCHPIFTFNLPSTIINNINNCTNEMKCRDISSSNSHLHPILSNNTINHPKNIVHQNNNPSTHNNNKCNNHNSNDHHNNKNNNRNINDDKKSNCGNNNNDDENNLCQDITIDKIFKSTIHVFHNTIRHDPVNLPNTSIHPTTTTTTPAPNSIPPRHLNPTPHYCNHYNPKTPQHNTNNNGNRIHEDDMHTIHHHIPSSTPNTAKTRDFQDSPNPSTDNRVTEDTPNTCIKNQDDTKYGQFLNPTDGSDFYHLHPPLLSPIPFPLPLLPLPPLPSSTLPPLSPAPLLPPPLSPPPTLPLSSPSLPPPPLPPPPLPPSPLPPSPLTPLTPPPLTPPPLPPPPLPPPPLTPSPLAPPPLAPPPLPPPPLPPPLLTPPPLTPPLLTPPPFTFLCEKNCGVDPGCEFILCSEEEANPHVPLIRSIDPLFSYGPSDCSITMTTGEGWDNVVTLRKQDHLNIVFPLDGAREEKLREIRKNSNLTQIFAFSAQPTNRLT